MTRLELVQRLCREAGAGNVPSTTIAQTGEYLRYVNWIDAAYDEIQSIHHNWNFLRADISFSTSSLSVLIPEFGSWKPDSFRCYLTATGVSDEQFLGYMEWDTFRDAYYFGTSRSQTGRPSIIAVKPNTDLLVWPTADDDYTITGEYFMRPQVLAADIDEPVFPLHQMAIVWKGLEYYGAYSSEPDKYAMGQSQFKKLIRKLEMSQTPEMLWGPPLA